MDLMEISGLGRSLMDQHGLYRWSLKFDRSVRRAGLCSHRSRIISLSQALMLSWSEEEVRNTILHEIAHAIVGPRHGHDKVWQAKAVEIGCDGKRLYQSDNVPVPPWIGICPGCKSIIQRFRRKQIACSRCCQGVYDERFAFVWYPNDDEKSA